MKKYIIALSILFTLLTVYLLTRSYEIPDNTPDYSNNVYMKQMKAIIDKTVEAENIPSLVVAVIKDGKIAGYINKGELTRGSKNLVNEHTLYQIGSLSKMFTAIITQSLILDGKINPDVSILNYLPTSISERTKNKIAPITINQLLSHTSGIQRDGKRALLRNLGFPERGEKTILQLFDDLEKMPLAFTPGSRHMYSNFGYALLGSILENATGQSYDQLLQNYVAKKYEMPKTTSIVHRHQPNNMATPYFPRLKNIKTKPFIMGTYVPAGGIVTTASDLANLMLEQMTSYKKMCGEDPLILNSNKTSMGNAGYPYYGKGIMEFRNTVDTTIHILCHGGDLDGFASNYLFTPGKNNGLILLTSSGGPWFQNLEYSLHNLLFDVNSREKIPCDITTLEKYAGDYYDSEGNLLKVNIVDNTLYSKYKDHETKSAFCYKSNVFSYKTWGSQLIFDTDHRSCTYVDNYTNSTQYYKNE